jgi:hypothetical protein
MYPKFMLHMRDSLNALRGRSGSDKTQLFFMVLMQAAFVGAIVLSIHEQAWLTLFVAVVALAVVWIAPILARNLESHLPLEFEFLLNAFIYGSIFLGEIRGFYTRFWWWDIVLHTGSGIALGFIGFLMLYSLYRSGRLRTSPFIVSIFSFSFAIALGTLWEIFEYFMDLNFGFNMQKSGLRDTMWDMIVNAVGAFLASLYGYFYMRRMKGKNGLADRLLEKF